MYEAWFRWEKAFARQDEEVQNISGRMWQIFKEENDSVNNIADREEAINIYNNSMIKQQEKLSNDDYLFMKDVLDDWFEFSEPTLKQAEEIIKKLDSEYCMKVIKVLYSLGCGM